ncbi:MAG: T9SS type A sorting domain-containing protein [Ignavibacteriae bacterium]|nr:T9SS C-terminal target domain-containing protein [Ignavibacteriota bacterium]NOG98820.1 T9SS type A sorting domain-containing protein [Ignavibacteriota bacterium]
MSFLLFTPKVIPQKDVFICDTNPDSLTYSYGELTATTWTLKILLVEFQDVKHKSPGYTYTDFNNLFFSNGIYVSPNKYSPDGEQVFGSMRDYLHIMSDGEFTLTGSVVNIDETKDGVPDWLTLPFRKGQYDSSSYSNFKNDAITAANTAGLNISTNSTTKLAIIYAGHTYRGHWYEIVGPDTIPHLSGLNPRASGSKYINGELFACCSPYRSERPDAKFSEIGINVHEFLHLMDIPDLYDNGVWDIMNGGVTLGPNYRGACPTPLNPQTRFKKGWLNFDLKTSDQTFQADYYLRDPEVFQIKNSSDPNNYWLIETRNFNATMTIGSTTTYDYNYYPLRSYSANPPDQGVLIWRVSNAYDWGKIIHADGKPWPEHPLISHGDPFPGSGGVKVLSPWSDTRTYPNPRYVPNTKPSSNVGMEIVGEGTNYFTIDFYAVNPLDASPSKPQNLVVTIENNSPRLNWTANTEPDVATGGKYKIYRAVTTGGEPTSFAHVATVNHPITTWLDYDYYVNGNGTNKLFYKVSAVDYPTNKESAKSDYDWLWWNKYLQKKGENSEQLLVSEYKLFSNFPNPFNPSTIIKYQIPESGFVQLKVYNVLGKEVTTLVNGVQEQGSYSAPFDASELAAGVYLYSIRVNDFSKSHKMLLLK